MRGLTNSLNGTSSLALVVMVLIEFGLLFLLLLLLFFGVDDDIDDDDVVVDAFVCVS